MLRQSPFDHCDTSTQDSPEDGDEFLEDAVDAGDEDVRDHRVARWPHVVRHQGLDDFADLRKHVNLGDQLAHKQETLGF